MGRAARRKAYQLAGPSDPIEKLAELGEFRHLLRTFLKFSEGAAKQSQMTVQQYQLLQVVGAAGDEGCSVAYVAKRLLLKHHSAVELVDRAEKRQLVSRGVDEADARKTRIRLGILGHYFLGGLVLVHLQQLREMRPALIKALEALGEGDGTVYTPVDLGDFEL